MSNGGGVGAARVATLVPLAIGLAMSLTGPSSSAPVPHPVDQLDAETMTSVSLVAVDKAIPRLDLATPASEVVDSWDKPTPSKSHLGACGWYGSEGADQETNWRKNRTDLPLTYHTVAFSALTDLEWPREAPTRRDRWTPEQLAVIEPYEGEALTVTGFIVALRPQAHNTETTNCEETGEENTDWHVAMVGEFGDPESQAVVVEATPRIKQKHPNWKPAQLAVFVGKPDSIRVSGFLFFDPVHKGHLGKYRRTLWEIHPIHRIEVWKDSQWIDIDDTRL